MKLSSAIVPLIYATLATSRSMWQTSPQKTLNDAFPVDGDNPLTYCANPSNYPLSIDFVDLNPNPPAAGQKLVVEASGYVGQKIEKGATVHLLVKYLKYITVFNQKVDLCDNLPKIGLSCPLEKGDLKIHQEADIPGVIPAGEYEVAATLYYPDGSEALCLQADVKY